MDTADMKKGSKPAEWKQQSGASKWCRLNSSINMDIPIFVPHDSSAQSLLKQIQSGLSDFFACLDKSVVTIGDQIQDNSTVISAGSFKYDAESLKRGSHAQPHLTSSLLEKRGCKVSQLALPEKFPVASSSGSDKSGSESTVELGDKRSSMRGVDQSRSNFLQSRSNLQLRDACSSDVNIYLPFQAETQQSSVHTQQCKANISIVGTSLVRAFVSAKATVAEAIEAVKTDVMRSIAARCELLCEEFDVAEVEMEDQVYDPPTRLFVQLPNTQIQVCDYVFQDEKFEEVVSRIHELLDIEDFDIDEVERNAAIDETISQPALPHFVDSVLQETSLSPSPSNSGTLLGIAAASVIALVAGGVSYVYDFV